MGRAMNKKRDAFGTGPKSGGIANVHCSSKDDLKELDVVALDHCYSKSWNSQSDLSHAETAKYLLWIKEISSSKPLNPKRSDWTGDDGEIDVETVDSAKESLFEMSKIKTLMTECERHMKLARPQLLNHDEPINRIGWSPVQNKVFNRVYKVLMSIRLARLAHSSTVDEPIHRRIYCDKHAKRVRQIFSSVSWDMEVLSWLHTMCMERLPPSLLSDYLEILQALKSKCPVLIDGMIKSSEYAERVGPTCIEALDLLLKRPWDPMTALSNRSKMDKLPRNAVILVMPQIPQLDKQLVSVKPRRFKQWNTQLSSMAKVIHAPCHSSMTPTDRWSCFDSMVMAVRMTIAETVDQTPEKPIVLVGWNFGALLATYVAASEKVAAVIALGYPLLGINGLRGDADDVIMDSATPTLFVVGENAHNCPISELENMRERMRAHNSLIVVGGANNNLNVNFKTKKERGVTQSMVDKRIRVEIHSYLNQLLSTTAAIASAIPLSQTPGMGDALKHKKQYMKSTYKMSVNKNKSEHLSAGKKRKGPIAGKKTKKQLRLEEPQTISISSSAIVADVGGETAAGGQLSMSSSSQGSLAALKPMSLSLPCLNVSPESRRSSPNQDKIKQEPLDRIPATRDSRPSSAASNTEDSIKAELPAYVQLSGNSGQTYAISMDKARELLNLGVLKGYTQSRVVGGSYETTRHLLSLPPGASFTLSSGQSASVSGAATRPTSSSNSESTGGSQQIRHLLSMDGQTVVPSSMKYKVAASNLESPSKTALPKRNTSPSPGQSLIKKVKVSAGSSISRQLLAASDGSGSKTISLVLGSTKAGDTPVIRMAATHTGSTDIHQLGQLESNTILPVSRITVQPPIVTTVGPERPNQQSLDSQPTISERPDSQPLEPSKTAEKPAEVMSSVDDCADPGGSSILDDEEPANE